MLVYYREVNAGRVRGTIQPMEPVRMARRGRLEELDRSFDIQFWQAQTSAARFEATWELVVHVAQVKGLDVHQLRLQRTVETFQRQRR